LKQKVDACGAGDPLKEAKAEIERLKSEHVKTTKALQEKVVEIARLKAINDSLITSAATIDEVEDMRVLSIAQGYLAAAARLAEIAPAYKGARDYLGDAVKMFERIAEKGSTETGRIRAKELGELAGLKPPSKSQRRKMVETQQPSEASP
jgi:hypothetical protein